MAGDLIYWKGQKVNFEEFISSKRPKKVRLGICIKEKAKLMYGYKFISLKVLK